MINRFIEEIELNLALRSVQKHTQVLRVEPIVTTVAWDQRYNEQVISTACLDHYMERDFYDHGFSGRNGLVLRLRFPIDNEFFRPGTGIMWSFGGIVYDYYGILSRLLIQQRPPQSLHPCDICRSHFQ